jgi:hypothetical protein
VYLTASRSTVSGKTKTAFFVKEESMNSAYKKEIRYTLIFSVLLLICGHMGLLFVAFPGLQNHMIFGFPSQYIVPVVFGWLVLMVVVGFQAKLTNALDDEIEALSGSSETTEGGR